MSHTSDITSGDGTDTGETIEAQQQAIDDLQKRIEELEKAVQTRTERYTILRDIVTKKTDLDSETIDELVERQLESDDR
ncbi:hypothetical protein [Halalkalicoccus jeotgali]|uniref:Uncharacterized protein n=1 Tax=Halalkalicoccus jeotgali (strain DSM 18796 / CECT 7217 / JCM 14584 / KCTC 4019 / B3) TaxID=795797 RepID=D8JD98_HALJB|nr:hypothetical protein [Halalkalicoccus jeotgali]ADJ17251.1 hypothetical protein HacjB3_19578 [Halalkalicoccus jeotgali B3]ELY41938.1 hypothetical protein C497_00010 [Halalkalicoccus jeotgali B3]